MSATCGAVDIGGNHCARPDGHEGPHQKRAVHTCHWSNCKTPVPPSMWGCKPHWFKLPKRLRDKIWAAYVPGQEISKDPSDKYLKVAEEVQDWIAANTTP